MLYFFQISFTITFSNQSNQTNQPNLRCYTIIISQRSLNSAFKEFRQSCRTITHGCWCTASVACYHSNWVNIVPKIFRFWNDLLNQQNSMLRLLIYEHLYILLIRFVNLKTKNKSRDDVVTFKSPTLWSISHRGFGIYTGVS